MRVINLLISLFGIIKTKALESVSVVNQKCIPRPKILEVNEGVGEALFYPYNVLVNKCSGSWNTLDDPMAKLCVPNIIKGINIKVYKFLMRLNETRNVLWHESCKCACRLNSSVCNSKQIWNSDPCRCDCKEDSAGIIDCTKGNMWNPSTCACECDMWCKPGQYLDYKKCVCKNKLIGIVIAECTSFINETTNIFIGLFSVLLFVGIVCFCVFAYFKWIKVNDFDVNSLEIVKRESRIGANIYYTGYVLNSDYDYDTINPLYFVINRLIGHIEEIKGSSDKYLVVAKNVRNRNIISALDMVWGSIKNKINPKPNIYPNDIEIKDYDKFRLSSDIDLPLDTLIEFRSLVINVSYVIEKDNEYYPEIYLDECLYIKGNVWPTIT